MGMIHRKEANMQSLACLSVIILTLSLTLLGCEATEAPEDIIPLAVQGFTFIEKNERIEGRNEGVQYSASSLFTPEEGSKFQNKVEKVQISVFLLKDNETATIIFERWTQGATQIKVNDVNTLLVYDVSGHNIVGNIKGGQARAIQQRGRLVIYSISFSPIDLNQLARDAPTPQKEDFDKAALQDAAIRCLMAIRL